MTKGKLTIVVGDVTNPQRTTDDEMVIIPHCCNNKKIMGAGVALALKKKWPGVEYCYQESSTELGTVSYFIISDKDDEEIEIVVANMIGQDGTVNPNNPKPVKYWALAKAMLTIKDFCEEINQSGKVVIHCPKFGSLRAGGNFDFVLELIKEIKIENGLDVVVYEFGE